MLMTKDTKIKFNTLQLLRGLAAISIVFSHGLINTDMFKYVNIIANTGVDLFFVLSGFILFFVHHREIGVKSKLKHFLIKRFFRIFPIYWIITGIYMVLVIPFGYSFSFEYIFKSLFLLPQQPMPIVGVAWTLEYEILLYILFSLIILNRKMFFPVLLIWSFIIVLFMSPSIQVNSLIVSRISNPINFDFLFGCGIAMLVKKNKLDYKWVPKAAIQIGILGIFSSLMITYLGLWKVHRVITWGLPSALLIFGLVKLEIIQKLRVPKIFIYLGNASYSIYLTHLISLLIFSKFVEKIGLLFNLVNLNMFYITSCILAVLVGCFFHAFIEKPLMNYFTDNIIKPSVNHTQARPAIYS